jgi:glycosyltransferase involved in cell wall biosynthesis
LSEHHEVLLFTFKDVAEPELGILPQRKTSNLRVFMHNGRGLKSPWFILNIGEILHELKKFRPEVIHYQESHYCPFVAALAFLTKYPLVLTIHDHLPHSGARQNNLDRWQRNFLRKYADMAIVHGKRIREEAEIILPWLKGRIVSVPHGPIGKLVAPVNKKWEQGILLFFGRLEKYKGLPYLIDAVEILKQQGVPIKTIVAGKGNDLKAYRKQIKHDASFELIERYINFDEVQLLFERANIVVLPYTDATQSGVAAMALRYGRPVVATDVGSIAEMVHHGYNGYLVPPRDALAFAEAAKKLVVDQSLAQLFASNAQLLVEREMSWASIAARSFEVYCSAKQIRRKRRLLQKPTRF